MFYINISKLKFWIFNLIFVSCIIFTLSSTPVYAYIGPSVGISLVGALGAVVVAVFLAIIGVFIWPVRVLMRKIKADKTNKQELKTPLETAQLSETIVLEETSDNKDG